MDIESKLELINRPPTEEVLTQNDLRTRLEAGNLKNHYLGLEISGKIHLGQGLHTAMKIVDFQKAGLNTNLFFADWHAWINNKLGGDWTLIKKAAKYYETTFKATIKALGGNPAKTNYILGSDVYTKNDEYWQSFFDVSKQLNLTEVKKGIDIAGRSQKDKISFSQLMYVPLQVNDIFEMKIDLAHAGTDQRKAHVLARQVSKKLTLKKQENKPIALHHKLLAGLATPKTIPTKVTREFLTSMKMSKSVEDSAIFLHDSQEDIKRKIRKAYCPQKNTIYNPVLEWAKYLILSRRDLRIERKAAFGGDVDYYDFGHLQTDFKKGELHPLDLKNAMTREINQLIKPIREQILKSKTLKIFDNVKITR